jgi:hypothetical protein
MGGYVLLEGVEGGGGRRAAGRPGRLGPLNRGHGRIEQLGRRRGAFPNHLAVRRVVDRKRSVVSNDLAVDEVPQLSMLPIPISAPCDSVPVNWIATRTTMAPVREAGSPYQL